MPRPPLAVGTWGRISDPKEVAPGVFRAMAKVRDVPGAVDVRMHQAFDYPEIRVDVDRVPLCPCRPRANGRRDAVDQRPVHVEQEGGITARHARFAAERTARTLAVAISPSIPTPHPVRPSPVRHSR